MVCKTTVVTRGAQWTVDSAFCFMPWCCVSVYMMELELIPGTATTRQRFLLIRHGRRKIGRSRGLAAVIYDARWWNCSYWEQSVSGFHCIPRDYSLCLSLASNWLDDSVRLEVSWSWSDSDSLSGSFREWRRFPFELCWSKH